MLYQHRFGNPNASSCSSAGIYGIFHGL